MVKKQLGTTKKSTKKLPANPLEKKTIKSKNKNPLFENTPRNFGIGNAVQPTRDLTRYVRWPRYIRLQRQKRILLMRLKVPPAINQFSHTVDKNEAIQLFKLLDKYRPETPAEKKARLRVEAECKASNKESRETKKVLVVKYGLNHITDLVENKLAKLVVIAHDVDPLELVVWLPALCRKKEIPFCIVKGKARLGQLVGQKTAAAVALTNVKQEDMSLFENLKATFLSSFNDNVDLRKRFGGGIMGPKSQAVQYRKQKAVEAEKMKKDKMML
eukprot:GHVR01133056.1.p1 GENE.GHVR01133056.1~~GHVR01133056.1.p1  ORF type:complete len:272 (+),score=60.33 GHVR01133056.1:152-967(+)